MSAARTPSRRKIWSKVFLTVVVPAPDEPVTKMIGCRRTSAPPHAPEEPTRGEQRELARRRTAGAVAGSARLVRPCPRAEDQRRARCAGRAAEVEDRRAARRWPLRRPARTGTRRVRLVDQAHPAVPVVRPFVGRVQVDAARGEDRGTPPRRAAPSQRMLKSAPAGRCCRRRGPRRRCAWAPASAGRWPR